MYKPNRIVGIMGPKASGKSTLADGFEFQGYQKLAFADALRDACAAAYGLDPHYFRALSTNQTTKEKSSADLGGKTPRQVLRNVGMYFRDNVHPDHWVQVLRKKIARAPGRCYVVQDVRFINEARMIQDMGGIVLGVRREAVWRPQEDLAPSEWTQYTHWHNLVDLEIHNEGSITDLLEFAEELARGDHGDHPQLGGIMLQEFVVGEFVTLRYGHDGTVYQIRKIHGDGSFTVEEWGPNPKRATLDRSELRPLQRTIRLG